MESRARSSAPAAATSLRAAAASGGPAPRMSTSRPDKLAATARSSGLPAPRRQSASPRAAASAPAIAGASTGQASIPMISCARARMKPSSSPGRRRRSARGRSRAGGPRHGRRRASRPAPRGRRAPALRQQPALPGGVEAGPHMLGRAAAADAEPPTDRRDPLGARGERFDEVAARAGQMRADPLAGQGAGDLDRSRRALREAAAAGAERLDQQFDSAAGIIHGGRRAGIPGRRRRRGSARRRPRGCASRAPRRRRARRRRPAHGPRDRAPRP